MKPVILSWSGGKDSALALQRLRENREFEVVALLTTFTREFNRVSMHGVRRELIQLQTDVLGIPLFEVWIDHGAGNDEYEVATIETLQPLREDGVTTIAFGDLFLEEIRDYRLKLMNRVGLQSLFPIWGENTRELAHRFIRDGYRARLCCVDTRKVDQELCGGDFDQSLLAEVSDSIDPCGENGEFHTFVYDGPIFHHDIPITSGAERRDGPYAFRDLLKVPIPQEVSP